MALTEQEAIAKIHSVYKAGKKNGLQNMRALMDRLGHAQESLRMIHVAGTNGKGSTCAMTERMLREAGYKTGLYSSPYIETYNERIRIDGEPIAGDALARLVERVWPAVEDCLAGDVAITEFELGTALAFLAFEEAQVDVAIIEVGLGGRLDPTNIITPMVSVITGVGLDHMAFLGDTIEEIAREKAGVIKPGVPVVLGAQAEAAKAVILERAQELDCEALVPEGKNIRETKDGVMLDAALGGEEIADLLVSLRGRHQADNALAALGAVQVLRSRGYNIPARAIRAALSDVRWPGRLERFGQVLLDGAHNDPGVRALCDYCEKWLDPAKTVLLTGMMEDKETAKMAALLAPCVREVVTTRPDVPRAMAAEKLAEAFLTRGLCTRAEPDVKQALLLAKSLAGEGDTVLCAGSLYLIGAVRTLLRQEKEF